MFVNESGRTLKALSQQSQVQVCGLTDHVEDDCARLFSWRAMMTTREDMTKARTENRCEEECGIGKRNECCFEGVVVGRMWS